ncbi:MAG: patatin family protein [Clostridia bacterium]|nr:patatin family protein [Clostridia bacterium]
MFINKGLVLEGGGMRGLYTTGVLDRLLEEDFEFRSVWGVSAGACHACSYVSKQHGRAFRAGTKYLNHKEYCSLYSLITTGDLFGVDFLYNKIPNELEPFDFEAFEKRLSRLFVVVCNCETGKAEYKELTDMQRDIIWVRASASLPLMSRMVEADGKKYLDGGTADSIPLKAAMDAGDEKNLVILTQHREFVKQPSSGYKIGKIKYRKYPQLVETMRDRHIMYNSQLDFVREQESKGNCLVIAPKEPLEVGRIEKDVEKLTRLYQQGYNDCDAMMGEIKKFLMGEETINSLCKKYNLQNPK